jgi:hypothetical protein
MADTEKPRAKGDMKCPLWQKPMKQVCHTCEWWTHIRGKHPQSDEAIDHWGCAIAFLPVLMIENSQMQRQTGAAVESFRNEVVKSSASAQEITARALASQRRVPDAIDYHPK